MARFEYFCYWMYWLFIDKVKRKPWGFAFRVLLLTILFSILYAVPSWIGRGVVLGAVAFFFLFFKFLEEL